MLALFLLNVYAALAAVLGACFRKLALVRSAERAMILAPALATLALGLSAGASAPERFQLRVRRELLEPGSFSVLIHYGKAVSQ